jgi:transposase
MAAPRKYPDELRERAVRLVSDKVEENEQLSIKAACREVGDSLGIAHDTLRGWVRRAQIDSGQRPGVPSDQRARISQLEKEVRELRRSNAILKTASAFFAAELDRPQPR